MVQQRTLPLLDDAASCYVPAVRGMELLKRRLRADPSEATAVSSSRGSGGFAKNAWYDAASARCLCSGPANADSAIAGSTAGE